MCAKANGRPVQAAVYVGLKIAKKFDAICPVQPISLGGGVTGYHLQKQSQGYVVPDAFTHGSSAQRTRWFMTGLKSGSVPSCDTFRTEEL
jgi:hypothetical protein